MKLLQIDRRGSVVREWKNIAEAADVLQLDSSHIGKCTRGLRATHGGFEWRYDNSTDTQLIEDITELSNESLADSIEKRSADYRKDSAVLSAKTEKSIQSLEEAIAFFEIDTEKWEVDRWVCNSWDVTSVEFGKRTNYQVKVFLKPKVKTTEEVLVDVNRILKDYVPKSINIVKGAGTITANFADFHIGADIRDLVRTKDFNIKILADYLFSSAEIINSFGANRVVLNLHGDFFESISGLNHSDSWKSMGKGM